MKLLQKTNRIYLLFSGSLFLIAGLLLYFLITNIMNDEVTDKLYVEKERVVQQLKKGNKINSIPLMVEIELLDSITKETLIVKDTNLMDPIEKDFEKFRELSAIEIIDNQSYKITLRQVVLEPHDYLNSIGLALGIVFILLLIGLLFINKIVSKKLWHPFYQNLNMLKQFSLQDTQPLVLKDSNINEFRELNTSLTQLAKKVSSDYGLLKEFTENASHEIQTPLAIIQAKLEEALQVENITEKQLKLISQASSSAQHLSKLNQTLLLLTKIENHQYNKTETISLKTHIEQQLQKFEDFIISKEIEVNTSINKDILLNGNATLIEILLSNLIGNAIKHNINKGSLFIELSANKLMITNTGEQLEVEPAYLFERFSKNNSASSSLGLGLALVKKIIEINHWDITYQFANKEHIITIQF